MEKVFLQITDISLLAGVLVLIVAGLRLVFRRAPKRIICLLWIIVAIRLVMPFSIQSRLSLIPSAEPISALSIRENSPHELPAVKPSEPTASVQKQDSPQEERTTTLPVEVVASPIETATPVEKAAPIDSVTILSCIWIGGVAAMLIYMVLSYISVRQKVQTATLLRDNLYQCETVASPFVLGLLRPRIYLPYSIAESDLDHVTAHENAHLRRHDHWIKPFAFLLLSFYWFNPLLWLAYILLCRDIELACDEKVISRMDESTRKGYATALINCGVNRRRIAACPLAFGEVGLKTRIKSIMNYKKPVFWVILLLVIAIAVTLVCFLTVPGDEPDNPADVPVATGTENPKVTPVATGTENPKATADPKNPVIVWKDAEFERLIRMALDKPEGDIHKNELLEIYAITICGKQCFVNSTALDWYSFDEETYTIRFKRDLANREERGSLNCLDDLVNFPLLTTFCISRTDVESIEAIKNAPYLHYLTVHSNRVKSIDKLYLKADTLECLMLEDEDFTDIRVLEELWNLKALSLNGNSIENISPIKSLTLLECLDLSENKIADISALENMRKLKKADLSGNQITSLEALYNLNELLELTISDCPVSTEEYLAFSDKLPEVEVSGFSRDTTNNAAGSKLYYRMGNQKVTELTVKAGQQIEIEQGNGETLNLSVKIATAERLVLSVDTPNTIWDQEITLNVGVVDSFLYSDVLFLYYGQDEINPLDPSLEYSCTLENGNVVTFTQPMALEIYALLHDKAVTQVQGGSGFAMVEKASGVSKTYFFAPDSKVINAFRYPPLSPDDFVVTVNGVSLSTIYTPIEDIETMFKIKPYKEVNFELHGVFSYYDTDLFGLSENYGVIRLSFKSEKLETARGIAIGDSLDELFAAYGVEEKRDVLHTEVAEGTDIYMYWFSQHAFLTYPDSTSRHFLCFSVRDGIIVGISLDFD